MTSEETEGLALAATPRPERAVLIAKALARIRAEGRREGLEKAAKIADGRARLAEKHHLAKRMIEAEGCADEIRAELERQPEKEKQ